MENRDLICVVCPVGCNLKAIIEDRTVTEVEGNRCKRGIEYAKSEILNPTRIVTSTVRVKDGFHPVCPVRTERAIPKRFIFDCMGSINSVELTAPVKHGQVIIDDLFGTGVKLVSTREMPRRRG